MLNPAAGISVVIVIEKSQPQAYITVHGELFYIQSLPYFVISNGLSRFPFPKSKYILLHLYKNWMTFKKFLVFFFSYLKYIYIYIYNDFC